MAPAIDDAAFAPGRAAILMLAPLGRRDDRTEVLDGASAQQHVPAKELERARRREERGARQRAVRGRGQVKTKADFEFPPR